MIHRACLLVVLPCLHNAIATDWPGLQTQYQTCTVIAGLGAANGDNNPNEWNNAEGQLAVNAELSEPHSAMADIYGRVFIADKNSQTVRRIDPDGTIHTVAGMNTNELQSGGTNAGYNGDGPARSRLLNGPQHAYVMPDGTFYVLDSENRMIRRVDTNGVMTTVITDSAVLNRGLWVSRDEQTIYYCTNAQLKRWTPALGNVAGNVVARGFKQTGNIDVSAEGDIYVTDRDGSAVYRVPVNFGGGTVTDTMRVAGLGTNENDGREMNGMPANQVGMREVRGIAFHPLGGYFLASHAGGDVWYVDTAGAAWMFIQGNGSDAHEPNPFPVPATSRNMLAEIRSVSVSLSGDLLIACNDAGYIRKVTNVLPRPAAPQWEEAAYVPGAGKRLRWQSEPGQWYLLEHSTTMNGDWSLLTQGEAAGASTEFTDAAAAREPRRFYRLHSFRGWPN